MGSGLCLFWKSRLEFVWPGSGQACGVVLLKKFRRRCAVCCVILLPYFRPKYVIYSTYSKPDLIFSWDKWPCPISDRIGYTESISSLDPKQCPFVLCLSMREYLLPGWPSTSATGPGIGSLGTKTVREGGFELPLYRLPPRFSCVAARNISQKSYEIESSIGKRRRRIY